jgi:hypothetical protein
MNRKPLRHNLWAVAGFAMLCTSSFAQEIHVDTPGGPKTMRILSGTEIRRRLAAARASQAVQTAPPAAAPSTRRLVSHVAYYSSLGAENIPLHFVGTNPTEEGGTTIIPTVLIPLKIVFSTGEVFDGSKVLDPVVNSPIFQKNSFHSGNVDLGVTQYGDALMRAQFWNLPHFKQDYHVLLGTPLIAPTVTIPIDVSQGQGFVGTYAGQPSAFVDGNLLDNILQAQLSSYTPDVLTIFWGRDLFATYGLGYAFGYHASLRSDPSSQAYIFTGYTDSGFTPTPIDMTTLSHEVAEWLNDPFPFNSTTDFAASNFAPPALMPVYGLNYLLEVGDPLVSNYFARVLNGTTYFVQDVVNPWWYLHTTPSPAANGWYTFQDAASILPLVVNSPAGIAGSYAGTARLSWAPFNTLVTGKVVYVGRGCPAGSIDGTNPDDPYFADPKGAIALIDRGSCTASLKVDRATRAGAIAVLIGDNKDEPPHAFGFGGGSQFAPSLSITKAISDMIKSVLGTAPVFVTLDPKNAIPLPHSTLSNGG